MLSAVLKIEKHTNLKIAVEDEESEDSDTSGVLSPAPPLSPSISRTSGDTATSRCLATWMSLIHTLQVRPLSQRCTLDPDTGLFCTVKWNPVPGLGLPPLLDGKD